MKKINIDMHIHSTYSDGLLTPAEIVEIAQQKRLQMVALTDHDTFDGIHEFLEEAKRAGVPCSYGIEFTCQLNGRDVHILGYNFQPNNDKIHQLVENFHDLQIQFNMKRIMNFAEKTGKTISIDRIPGTGNMTPIRLAYWLMDNGLIEPAEFPTRIKDIYPLFEDQNSDLNYSPHLPLAEDVVEIIAKAHGYPVLAHPQSMNITFDELYQLYSRGLKGIEAFYPDQKPEVYLRWASQFKLGVTAGTDYHGVLDRNERSIGFALEVELPKNVYFYTGDLIL